ncbi:SDR family NAD(P)-dependent oxidoreductase [Streptomyces coelicoflavus]|uniref:SDR family NAD(P)-dependent oxidoreductase n=1 Tax=Streptomyces coelicoflavus TaxID=285562 RepID=A0A6N9UBF8_9ACTN|nr:SDR family NAD(P)-dependent oxidoreductase [Streptomyces coelicoflavus]NEB15087.1 SDR family NAD(P)-dependent oxidoreductase [Streptomyces coelicoflavus]
MSTLAIVGAGPQLGRAIGRRFAAEGVDVALIARSRTTLQAVADELSDTGVRAEAFPADVTDRPALHAALTAAEERLGPIDILEYSPAPSPADLRRAPLVEATKVTVDSVLAQLDLYLLGGVAAVQHVLPGMLERGTGTILVSSGAGSGPVIAPHVANVQIATGGMRNWILNLHAALSGTGVYAAHVAIAAYIGQGGHDSQPQTIADAYWRLHTGRTEAELVVQDLPDDYLDRGLADKFVEP